MKTKLQPITVSISPELQQYVLDACSDYDTPETREDWEELIKEVLEEYFNA